MPQVGFSWSFWYHTTPLLLSLSSCHHCKGAETQLGCYFVWSHLGKEEISDSIFFYHFHMSLNDGKSAMNIHYKDILVSRQICKYGHEFWFQAAWYSSHTGRGLMVKVHQKKKLNSGFGQIHLDIDTVEILALEYS